MSLTNAQIRRLRAEGHRLKLRPVVTIGQKGFSENLDAEIEAALQHHELIKLRIPALARPDKRALGERICREHRAQLIEAIGNVLVIYRCNPEKNRYARLLTR